MFKSGVYSLALRGVTLISRFPLVLIMARYLSPEEIGQFGIMTVSILISVSVLGFEFHNYNARELLAYGEHPQARLIRDQLAFHLLVYLTILPLGIFLFATDVLPWKFLGWFYALLVLEHLSQESSRLMIYLSRPLMSNVILFLRAGAWVYGVGAAFLLHNEARSLILVWGGWAAGVGSSLVVAAYSLRHLDWNSAWAEPVDWNWIRRGIRTSLLFFCSALSYRTMEYGDRYFIQFFWGNAMVGVYTFYNQIANLAQTFLNSGVLIILLPKLILSYQAGDQKLYRNLRRQLAVAAIGASLVLPIILAVMIYPLIYVVDRPIYQSHLPAYWVLLGSIAVKMIGQIFHLDLYAKREDQAILASSLGALIAAVGMNALLVPQLGVLGAAIGTTVAAFTMGAMKFYFVLHPRVARKSGFSND